LKKKECCIEDGYAGKSTALPIEGSDDQDDEFPIESLRARRAADFLPLDITGEVMKSKDFSWKKIGMKIKNRSEEVREQIQEDVITYLNPLLDRDYELSQDNIDDLCQIIVDNFKKLEENWYEKNKNLTHL